MIKRQGKAKLGLWEERLEMARARPRPKLCEGCSCNPLDEAFDPLRSGGYTEPSGPKAAKLWVIAIAPGEEEEVRGDTLSGPSGRMHGAAIRIWKPIKVYKLNVVRCRTTEIGAQGRVINRSPNASEMRACAKRFLFPALASSSAACVQPLSQLVTEFLLKEFGEKWAWMLGHRVEVPRDYFLRRQGDARESAAARLSPAVRRRLGLKKPRARGG